MSARVQEEDDISERGVTNRYDVVHLEALFINLYETLRDLLLHRDVQKLAKDRTQIYKSKQRDCALREIRGTSIHGAVSTAYVMCGTSIHEPV